MKTFDIDQLDEDVTVVAFRNNDISYLPNSCRCCILGIANAFSKHK